MKRILVSGATGFLGGAVARRLHEDGHEVLATGRNVDAGRRLAAEGILFQAGDIRDADFVRAASA